MSHKKSAASSSAAAKTLSDSGTKLSSIGFGGFTGGQQLEISGEITLPPELHQYIKQLTKRHTTTKLKALQNLEACLSTMTVEQSRVLFPQWVVAYRALSRDLEKAVRLKSVEVLDLFVRILKRDLAPFLKSVIGPWWIAQHDEHHIVTKAAKESFQAAFPGEKSAEAVLFCAKELVKYLGECLEETPETVGDPKHESKEEREFKLLFVFRASLLSVHDFVSRLVSKKSKLELIDELGAVLLKKSILKRALTNHGAEIRSGIYRVLKEFCISATTLIQSNFATIAPMIFNCLSEEEQSCHQDMWSLVLAFFSKVPEAWNSAPLEKSITPKICSTLRRRKSPDDAYDDAIIIFLSQIPQDKWNQDPVFLIKIFQSSWKGSVTQVPLPSMKLLLECFLWGLLSSSLLAPSTEHLFRKKLISETVLLTVAPAFVSHMDFCVKFLTESILKLLEAVRKQSDRLPIVLEVLEAIVSSLSSRLEESDIPEAISKLFQGIYQKQDLEEAEANLVYDRMGMPLGKHLTQCAFSQNPSEFCAYSLYESSKVLRKSIISFDAETADLSTTHLAIELFERTEKLMDGIKQDFNFRVYFDLVILSVWESPHEASRAQWASLLSRIYSGLTQDAVKWNEIFFLLLSSLNNLDSFSDLKLSDIPHLSLLDTRCIHLLIKFQKHVLESSTYKFLLKELLKQDSEILGCLCSALVQSDSVEAINDEDVILLWTEATAKAISIGWRLVPASSTVLQTAQSEWNKGQILDSLSSPLKQNLVLALKQEVLQYLAKDPNLEIAAHAISELFALTNNSEEILKDCFFNGDWCRWWWVSDQRSNLSSSKLISILCTLIKKHGPYFLSPEFSLTPLLFMELLCDLNVDSNILSLALDYLLELYMKGNDSIITQLVERCLVLLKTVPEEVHSFSAALQSLLIALSLAPDQIKALQLIESISSKFVLSLEFPLKSHIQEAVLDILPHMVLPLRQGSLISIINGALEDLSVHCLEQTCSQDYQQSKTMKNICFLCFPVPLNIPIPCLYATPEERTALLAWSKVEDIEIWKRIVIYCPSEMETSDWSNLHKSMLVYLEKKILLFESLCEELLDIAVSTAQDLSSSIQSPSEALHLLYILTRKNQKLLNSVPQRVEEFLAKKSEKESNIVEIFDASLIIIQCLGHCDLNQTILQSMALCLRVVLCLGSALTTANLLSFKLQHHLLQMFAVSDPRWRHLTHLFEVSFEDSGLQQEVLKGIDLWGEETSIDSVSCLLELLFTKEIPEALRSCFLKLLASDHCIESLIHENDLPELTEEEWRQQNQTKILSLSGIHQKLSRMSVSDESRLISWSLILTALESGSHTYCQHFSYVLREIPAFLDNLLAEILPFLPLHDGHEKQTKSSDNELLEMKKDIEMEVMRRENFTLKELLQSIGLPATEVHWHCLGMKLYHVVISLLPVAARLWFHSLSSKRTSWAIKAYTTICESPQLIKKELDLAAQETKTDNGLKVKSVFAKREVVATVFVEEQDSVELVIKLPECMPLKPMTTDWRTKVNVENATVRKWLFSVAAFLSNHSGPVIEAIELWSKSLQGLMDREKCLICFCVVHPSTRNTPDLCCKTCKLEFHSACLYSWFRQSAKSACPHCQSPWAA